MGPDTQADEITTGIRCRVPSATAPSACTPTRTGDGYVQTDTDLKSALGRGPSRAGIRSIGVYERRGKLAVHRDVRYFSHGSRFDIKHVGAFNRDDLVFLIEYISRNSAA